MCKHCKRKQEIQDLRDEISQLREMVKELKGKMDEHTGHYIYPFTTTYPYTYTFPNTSITYTNDGGNGEG